MKPVQLTEPGQQKPATFEDPESMLLACHQRVQRMCALLLRLHAHANQNGADEQANYGGITMGDAGPVSEGFWAFIIGIGGFALIATWIAKKGARAR